MKPPISRRASSTIWSRTPLDVQPQFFFNTPTNIATVGHGSFEIRKPSPLPLISYLCIQTVVNVQRSSLEQQCPTFLRTRGKSVLRCVHYLDLVLRPEVISCAQFRPTIRNIKNQSPSGRKVRKHTYCSIAAKPTSFALREKAFATRLEECTESRLLEQPRDESEPCPRESRSPRKANRGPCLCPKR